MKRIISYLMVFSIILAGAAALADAAEASSNSDLLKLQFSQVERQVRTGNITIKNNGITLQNIDEMLVTEDYIPTMLNNQNALIALRNQTASTLFMIASATDSSLRTPVEQGLILSLGSDIESLNVAIGQISSQIEQVGYTPRATRDKTNFQLNNVNNQIVWGAESLYMGYYALVRQLDLSKENLKMLDRNIAVMERRLSLGQITERTLLGLRNNRAQLEQGIKTIENESVNMKSQLNLLIGRDFNAPVELDALPAAKRDFLSSIDKTRDLKAARNSNHVMNIARIDRDEQARKLGSVARGQENIASNNYDNELRNVELKHENLMAAIKDKEMLLALEEAQLAFLQQALDETRTRYGLGKVSKLDLEKAESDVYIQTIKVSSADADLFSAIRKYEWFVRGLSV